MINRICFVVLLAALSALLMGQEDCTPPEASVDLTTFHDGDTVTVAKTLSLVAVAGIPAGATLTAVKFYKDAALVYLVPSGGLGEPSWGYFFTPDPGTYLTSVHSVIEYERADLTTGSATSLTIVFDVDIPGPPCTVDVGGHCAMALANEALDLWGIGLPPVALGTVRTFDANGPGLHDPSHWIAIGCNSPGLSPSMKAFCLSKGPFAGYCDFELDTPTGEIVESTAVIGPAVFAAYANNEDRRHLIAHEVGHCLGLKHTPLPNLMASGGGNRTPTQGELSALAEAYVPPAAPTQTTADVYYWQSGGNTWRQHSAPQYVMDATYVE